MLSGGLPTSTKVLFLGTSVLRIESNVAGKSSKKNLAHS